MHLRLEWLRLKGFRFFWIFLGGYGLCLLLTLWMGTQVLSGLLSGVSLPGMASLGFGPTMAFIFYLSGFYESFLALILIMMISNDYGLGTLKQHVIDGLSYEGVVLGRFVQTAVLVAFSFFIVFALALVFAGRVSGEALTLPTLSQIGAYFLRSFGFLSFAVLLVSIVKKAIPTVLAYFGWRFIVEPGLGYFLGFYLEIPISQYLPLAVFGQLVDGPQKILSLGGMLPGLGDAAPPLAMPPFVLAVLYFLLFWVGIYATVKYRRFQ